jgi:hypothetical protein
MVREPGGSTAYLGGRVPLFSPAFLCVQRSPFYPSFCACWPASLWESLQVRSASPCPLLVHPSLPSTFIRLVFLASGPSHGAEECHVTPWVPAPHSIFYIFFPHRPPALILSPLMSRRLTLSSEFLPNSMKHTIGGTGRPPPHSRQTRLAPSGWAPPATKKTPGDNSRG